MKQSTCLIPDCDEVAHCRGLCAPHYGKAHRTGDLESIALPRKMRKLAPPILTEINPSAMTVTCSNHGPGVRLRARLRQDGRSCRYSCRRCDRGESRKPGGRGVRATREQRRIYRLKKKYGLTMEEYQVRLEAQQGLCLICQQPMAERVAVDHDHTDGHVRGLLCHACNVGLGFFRDNPAVMKRAVKYVERYRLPDVS